MYALTGCYTEGAPVHWGSDCLCYAIQRDGSIKQGITAEHERLGERAGVSAFPCHDVVVHLAYGRELVGDEDLQIHVARGVAALALNRECLRRARVSRATRCARPCS